MRIKEINIVGSRTINIGNYESRHASYGMTIEIEAKDNIFKAEEEAEAWIKQKLERFENGWKNPQREVRERVRDINNNTEKSQF